MEKINIEFAHGKAFGVDRFEIDLGQSFILSLSEKDSDRFEWFASDDPVLKIEVSADTKSARVTSTASGQSKILFRELRTFNGGKGEHCDFTEFHVVVRTAEATSLGMQWGTPSVSHEYRMIDASKT